MTIIIIFYFNEYTYCMKKFFVFFILIPLLFVCVYFVYKDVGKSKIYNNSSQIEQNYFNVKTNRYFAEIYFGEREIIYEFDGISTPKKDYGLIKVNVFNDDNNAKNVNCILKINDKSINLNLIKNPFENNFVFDVEILCKNTDIIEIFIPNIDEDFNKMNCISQNFKSNYNQALEMGYNFFKEFIKNNKYECYLTILFEKFNNNTNYFWSFVLQTTDYKSKSLIMDIDDLSVLFVR